VSGRVVRLGVSLEPELLDALDRWVARRGSPSRSEALRFLVRKELAEVALSDPEADAVGTVMVLYDHRRRDLPRRLTRAQHRWGEHLRSSVHVHLEGDACVEVMVLLGRRGELEAAAEELRGLRGISVGDYLLATPRLAGGRTGHRHPHRRSAREARRERPLPAAGAASGPPPRRIAARSPRPTARRRASPRGRG
jgi:CopG family transcriptional regulator, nickel-responsive regulator